MPKHWHQLRMSGTSRLGGLRLPLPLPPPSPWPPRRSASMLSRSSCAMSTKSPFFLRIFPTSFAGMGGKLSLKEKATALSFAWLPSSTCTSCFGGSGGPGSFGWGVSPSATAEVGLSALSASSMTGKCRASTATGSM